MQQIKIYELNINPSIKRQQIVKDITTIVYQKKEFEAVKQFLKSYINTNDYKINEQYKVKLLKSKTGNRYFLIYQFMEQLTSIEQFNTLQKVICLGDHILSVGINNSIQSLIQKTYLHMLDYVYRSDPNRKLTLTFVKQNHKESSTFRQRIKYFKYLNEECLQPQKKFEILTIEDIAYIYQYCTQPQRYNVCKVKLTLQKFKKLKNIKENFEIANKSIFCSEKDRKIVERDINRMKLPKKIYDHLMWKSHQLHIYHNILQQRKDTNNDYELNLTYNELDVDITRSGLSILHYRWSQNSLAKLKQLFNKINSEEDYKGINEFRETYQDYLQNLEAINERIPSKLLNKSIQQLKQFVKYHNGVIKRQTFSSIKYYKNEAKYLWNYNRSVYKKLTAFMLIIILSLLQNDVIKGITIISIGIIFLSIKI